MEVGWDWEGGVGDLEWSQVEAIWNMGNAWKLVLKNKPLNPYEKEAKIITSVEGKGSEEADRAEYGQMDLWIDVIVVMEEWRVRYVVQ